MVSLVKKARQETEYTPEMLLELEKCSKDPIYFIETYVKIQHPIRGEVQFIMFDFQKRIINSYLEHRWNIVLTSRQVGKTVTSACYLLWYAIFRFDSNLLITSRRNDDAMDIVSKIKYAYEGLPDWLRPGVDEYSKHSIVFDNGSRISAQPTTENTGRGQAITILYLDEFAFVPPRIAEAFWASITPTLSCLTGDTMVLTKDGYRKIEEFHKDRNIGEYFKIPSLEVWGRDGMEKVSHGYVSPESDTLIIRNSKGLEIETTLNHPLLKADLEPIMTPSCRLQEGDYLRTDVGMNQFSEGNQIDPEFAYLLGGYIAEGWIHKIKGIGRTIYISNTDPEFRSAFLESNIVKKFQQDPSRKDKIKCCSTELVNEFIKAGINPNHLCHEKRIPHEIFGASRESVSSFLRALFDGDGCCSERAISYSSTSKKLIQEVYLLLINFGFIPNIKYTPSQLNLARRKKTQLPQGGYIKTSRDSWDIEIPHSQYQKFLDEIGFGIQRKVERAESIIEHRDQNDYKLFSIPVDIIKPIIEELLDASPKSLNWFRRTGGIRLEKVLDDKPNRKVNRYWVKCFITACVDSGIPYSDQNIKRLLEFDRSCFWSSISNIEESTNKTYDFTVPKTHSFLQNGIIGSNTGGDCIITSTPNGDEDTFSSIWVGAISHTNGFNAIEVQWQEHPERDEAYKRSMISKIGELRWRQEYNNEFLSSQESLISGIRLGTMKGIKPEYEKNGFKFWEEPEAGQSYIIGCDVGTGTGGDFSTIECFTFPGMVQVAEFRDNQTPTPMFAGRLVWLLNQIEAAGGESYYSVENNGVGEGVITALTMMENNTDVDIPGTMIHDKGRGVRGLNTSNRAKLSSCMELKNLVDVVNPKMTIKSKPLITELKFYVRKGASFAARIGATDDLIAAILIMLRVARVAAEYDMEAYDRLYSIDPDMAYGDEDGVDEDPLPILF